MSTSDMMKRWRGLKALVEETVVNTSRAVEEVQKRTADRPFAVLARIPPVAEVANGVHVIHDVALAGVHGTIRGITRVVGKTLDVALDLIEPPEPPAGGGK